MFSTGFGPTTLLPALTLLVRLISSEALCKSHMPRLERCKTLKINTFPALVHSFTMIALLASPSVVGAQEQKYLIDHAIEHCRGNDEPGNHTALAFSSSQRYGCGWRYSTIDAARQRALTECKKRVPPELWQKARCKVVWEDGIVTDQSTVSAERTRIRVPMEFEIFDGVSGKREFVDGHMVTGKYADPDRRPFSFVVGSGATICKGHHRIQYGGTNAKVYADIRCFDEFSSKINGAPLNRFVKVGNRYIRYFEARFTYKNSYIQPRLK